MFKNKNGLKLAQSLRQQIPRNVGEGKAPWYAEV
jgi:hypothetical protein